MHWLSTALVGVGKRDCHESRPFETGRVLTRLALKVTLVEAVGLGGYR